MTPVGESAVEMLRAGVGRETICRALGLSAVQLRVHEQQYYPGVISEAYFAQRQQELAAVKARAARAERVIR